MTVIDNSVKKSTASGGSSGLASQQSEPGKRTRRSKEERLNRILVAAAELIAQQGYDNTSVEDIARRAGISKGAVYLHFSSKDALVDAALMRESESMFEDVLARVEADPRGLTFFTLYSHAIAAAFSNPLLRALYTEDRRVLGEFARRSKNSPLLQRGMVFGADFVRGFQENGLLRKDIPPEVMAYVMLIVRFGMFTIDEYVPKEQAPPIEQVASAIAELFDGGFAAHGPPQHQARSYEILNQLLNYGREAFRQMREFPNDSEKKGKGSGA